MTDLQIMEMLCSVIEQQSALIRKMIVALKQADALTDEMRVEQLRIMADYEQATWEAML